MRFLLLILCFQHLFAHTVVAPGKVKLSAGEIVHDTNLSIIFAKEDVVLSQIDETVSADFMAYDKKLGIVSASGHVIYHRKNGDIVRADYIELSEDLSQGFIQAVSIHTASNERVQARTAQKYQRSMKLNDVAYTPCKLCSSNETPTWELRASSVDRDEEKKDITYHDVFLELWGKKVFYFPWFRHPEPSVKRRSGLLAPTMRFNSVMGMGLVVPYYVVLSDQKDMTIFPIMTTKAGNGAGVEYRSYTQKGVYRLSAVSTYMRVKNRRTIGNYIEHAANFNLSNTWRLNYDINYVSHKEFMKEFHWLDKGYTPYESALKSVVHAENFFSDSSYIGIHGYKFQSIRSDGLPNSAIPLVLPFIEYSAQYALPIGYLSWDANALSLYRATGQSVRRVSGGALWEVPVLFNSGLLQEFFVRIRGDGYSVSHSKKKQYGRYVPSAGTTLRYPFFMSSVSNRVVFEPIVQMIIASDEKNRLTYINEDSLSFEFDPLSLFSRERNYGFDMVDEGIRLNYGLNAFSSHSDISWRAFLGQSFRFRDQKGAHVFGAPYRKGSSNVVGNVQFTLFNKHTLRWSFMMPKESRRLRRSVVDFSLCFSRFSINSSYILLDKVAESLSHKKMEQLQTALWFDIHEHWKFNLSWARQFSKPKGMLEHRVGLIYHNDCFAFKTEVAKTFYRGDNLMPATTIMFTLSFKNLGDVSTGRFHTPSSRDTEEHREQI